MREKNGCRNWTSKVVVFIIALLFVSPSLAQESGTGSRSTAKQNLTKVWDFAVDTYYFIYKMFNECDSTYVTPKKYHMKLTSLYTHCYEHYKFTSTDGKQSISVSPDNRNKLGLQIGWRGLAVGYNIDLQKKHPQTDFNVSLYSARAGLDLFYRKSSEGYTIRGLKGFKEGDDASVFERGREFNGITVRQIGLNVYYIFNKKFSYPAAYTQSSQQRISAGSFILGAGYNHHKFRFDKSAIDTRIVEQLQPGLLDDIKYHDLNINFGYSYNWVFAKNFLANISLTPAIGYKNPSLKMHDSKELLPSINFDFITRASIVYNNGKYYGGTSLVSHTYTYDNDKLSIINGFGVLKVFFGFKFWRKK